MLEMSTDHDAERTEGKIGKFHIVLKQSEQQVETNEEFIYQTPLLFPKNHINNSPSCIIQSPSI